MKATRRFLPSAISPWSVEEPSARTSPALTVSPTFTRGFWWISVPWLERANLCSSYSSLPSPCSIDDRVGVDVGDRAGGFRPAGRRRCRAPRGAPCRCRSTGASGFEQRHCLALHVRAHQRAVGVVVLEERDHRRRDGPDLRRGDVHEVDLLRARPCTYWPACVRQTTSGPLSLPSWRSTSAFAWAISFGLLLRRVEADELVGDDAVLDDAVGRRHEAVLGDLGVARQRADQADVRALRASRSGTCARSGSGGRRGPRSARARA